MALLKKQLINLQSLSESSLYKQFRQGGNNKKWHPIQKMVNDTGALVWGKAQETLQSFMSIWRGHSLLLNIIHNNNKVKTMTKKNTTERKVFSVNMRIKVTINLRIGKVITAKQLQKRKSNRWRNCLLEMFLCFYYRISTNWDLNLRVFSHLLLCKLLMFQLEKNPSPQCRWRGRKAQHFLK